MCGLVMLNVGANTALVAEISWNECLVIGEWALCAVMVSYRRGVS